MPRSKTVWLLADVSLANDGTIQVVADAFASANGANRFGSTIAGFASASAVVGTGIYQSASASGFGLATLVHFAGSTSVGFLVGNASAAVDLTNTGAILVNANAGATGGTAFAFASVSDGIDQQCLCHCSVQRKCERVADQLRHDRRSCRRGRSWHVPRLCHRLDRHGHRTGRYGHFARRTR